MKNEANKKDKCEHDITSHVVVSGVFMQNP